MKLLTHPRSLVSKYEITSDILSPVECRNLADFAQYGTKFKKHLNDRRRFELSLLSNDAAFRYDGYCAVCNMQVAFKVDYVQASLSKDGKRIPFWRERLACPKCTLNNRMRATILFLKKVTGQADTLYLTERTTDYYRAVADLYPDVVGSEFLRDGTPRGMTNGAGIRHEDATCLTFNDDSLDAIGSFEVLEHVPEYRRALAEFHRCLRPGGTLIMTTPVDITLAESQVRAELRQDGSIIHLLPPEYHGDPMDDGGVLCFHNFGWSLLDDMRAVGFADSRLAFFWSRQLGHLGSHQFVITAHKTVAA